MQQYFDKFCNHILNENSQKQIIQKIFGKKKNASTVFLGLGYMHFSEKKTKENHICVASLARKVENLVRFLSSFEPYIPSIRRVRKGTKYVLKVLEYIAKILKVLKAWK